MVVPIFNTRYAVQKFDRINEFGVGSDFKKRVDAYLDLPCFKGAAKEQRGRAITTVGQDDNYPLVPCLDFANNDIGKWIYSAMVQSTTELGVQTQNPNWFCTPRTWANRLYTGCSGKAHRHHHAGSHLVAIFYYEAPVGSGDLVFIDSNESSIELGNRELDSYPPEQIHRVTPEPGMLICHNPWVVHAVDTHRAEDYRTSFIFEFTFMDMPIHSLLKPVF